MSDVNGIPVRVDAAHRGIIILEGADCSGKTTLAGAIRKVAGNHGYEHCGISDEVWDLHVGIAVKAGNLGDKMVMIVDRLWLSEQVYGQAYRGGPAYDFGARFLDRTLTAAGAITVLCVPSDLARQSAIHAERAARGGEAFSDVAPSIALYWKLRFGDALQCGETYLDELIRGEAFVMRDTVVCYDFMEEDVDAVAARIVRLADAKHRPWFEAVKEAMK